MHVWRAARNMPFQPKFTITLKTAKALMAIESLRARVDRLPVTPRLIASLRESARLLSTHYSTQIEGNRLSAAEVKQVLGGHGGFPGRERDEREVRNYLLGLDKAEELALRKTPLHQRDLKELHALVLDGSKRPSHYRDGQNVIRDGATGAIVYMPPEAKEVAGLMAELVEWINDEIEHVRLPVPVIGGLAHYQFATIHPYYDGNGRTARLLTTLILQRCHYGLKGLYSLEEYYARNLGGYYRALTVGDSHNYHLGRAEADVSGFVEYFCEGMADAFAKVCAVAEGASKSSAQDQTETMRELRPQQRQVLGWFAQNKWITSRILAGYLGIAPRQGRELCAKWVAEGFLNVVDPAKKSRSYRLAQRYEQLL